MKKLWRLGAGVGVLASLTAATPAPAPSEVFVNLAGLRNAKGQVHLCLTNQAARFLKCQDDKQAVALSVPAGKARQLSLGRVPPGTYALLVVHDENGNGKLDMMLGIPREGFGFSNNPTIRMRAPRFDEVRFNLAPGQATQNVRLKYVL